MKKIFSLILCAVMVLPMLLTACSDGYRMSDSTAAKATTITITTICEEGTTDEAITLVQNAINSLTESQYNTHVVLRMMTADKYEEFLLSKSEYNYLQGIGAVEEDEPDKKEEDKDKEDEEKEVDVQKDESGQQFYITSNGDKHLIDENGRGHVVYPEATENQLDIVLIPSLSLYDKLVYGYEEKEKDDKGNETTKNIPYLTVLGREGETPFDALLDKYVPSYATSARKALNLIFRSDTTGKLSYAIPNNTYFGSYRYLLINKELFDKYQYDLSTVNSMSDLLSFVNDLLVNKEPVSPLYSYAGYGWQSFLGEDSVLSIPVANSYNTEVPEQPAPVFASSAYRQELSVLRNLKNAGYTWSENEDISVESIDKPFGVAVVRGDSTIPEQYKDKYYVRVFEKPQLTSEMYNGMYGISSGCAYPARAMEILTLLSTNADIVNLLAYGVEGAHYDLSSGGMVTNRSKDYRINIRYAGNMFLLRQNNEMDEKTLRYSANNWELAKLQNRDLVLNPYCGFEVKMTDSVPSLLENVKELNDKIHEELENYDKYVQEGGELTYDEYLQSLEEEIRKSAAYEAVSQVKTSRELKTPYQQYYNFFMDRYEREA